jgi:hypothetical protein
MKRLLNLMILGCLTGMFFSGFVYWMANRAHQQAERSRQQGESIPPGNAASVARNALVTCAGFTGVAITALAVTVLYRTRRIAEPPLRTRLGRADTGGGGGR